MTSRMIESSHMDANTFESLVDQAIEELPVEFRDALDNVSITVQDWPTRQQLRGVGMRGRFELLGLYQGVPQTERGDHYNLALPDTIILFRKPIEAQCRSAEEVRQTIRDTLQHEIAHHFWTGEGRIRASSEEKPAPLDIGAEQDTTAPGHVSRVFTSRSWSSPLRYRWARKVCPVRAICDILFVCSDTWHIPHRTAVRRQRLPHQRRDAHAHRLVLLCRVTHIALHRRDGTEPQELKLIVRRIVMWTTRQRALAATAHQRGSWPTPGGQGPDAATMVPNAAGPIDPVVRFLRKPLRARRCRWMAWWRMAGCRWPAA